MVAVFVVVPLVLEGLVVLNVATVPASSGGCTAKKA
jgi:hypothetical protein